MFRREGWNWRWVSLRRAAAVAAAWAAPLVRFPLGTRASFSSQTDFRSVVLDLAVQAAGLVAVPQEGLQGQQGRQGLVEIAGESVVLPSWEEAERSGIPAPEPERMTGGDLAIAAERLRRVIPELPEGRRHVVVLAERSLLSWATVVGAAILLEPEPAHYVPTAVWARPTVFAGTVADLARLREAAERAESGFRIFRRRRLLPFGRLRAVLVTEGELPEEESAFWEERGVFAAERQERGI